MESHFLKKKYKIVNCSLKYQKYLIKTNQKISIEIINSNWLKIPRERPLPNKAWIKAMKELTKIFLNLQAVKM